MINKRLSIVINIFCLFACKFKDCARGSPPDYARQLLYIYIWIISTDTQTPSQLYRNTFFVLFFFQIHYIWYMAYLDTDDFDCIAYIDEKTNAVTVKFVGIPNKQSAELFINYVMVTLGVDFRPLDQTDRSKMIH